jgi:hypothetical protein
MCINCTLWQLENAKLKQENTHLKTCITHARGAARTCVALSQKTLKQHVPLHIWARCKDFQAAAITILEAQEGW